MTLSHSRGAVAAGALLMAVIMAIGAPLEATPPDQSAPASRSASAAPPQAVKIGDVVSRERLHMVTRPGAYGLSNPPAGNGYAIVSGQLVRIDISTGKILSALRRVERILD